jgi:hypothetical protein
VVDLEIRLEALEAEVKVLKNEIQTILLEIQEQVLLHYYPSLRVEDDEPSDTVIQALEEVRRKRQAAADPAEATTTTHAAQAPIDFMVGKIPGNGDSNGADLGPPRAAERSGAWRTPSRAVTDPSLPLPPPSGVADFHRSAVARESQSDEWGTFSEMAAWVQESINRIGAERTTHLIELYAEQGILSPQAADGLARLMSLFV